MIPLRHRLMHGVLSQDCSAGRAWAARGPGRVSLQPLNFHPAISPTAASASRGFGVSLPLDSASCPTPGHRAEQRAILEKPLAWGPGMVWCSEAVHNQGAEVVLGPLVAHTWSSSWAGSAQCVWLRGEVPRWPVATAHSLQLENFVSGHYLSSLSVKMGST